MDGPLPPPGLRRVAHMSVRRLRASSGTDLHLAVSLRVETAAGPATERRPVNRRAEETQWPRTCQRNVRTPISRTVTGPGVVRLTTIRHVAPGQRAGARRARDGRLSLGGRLLPGGRRFRHRARRSPTLRGKTEGQRAVRRRRVRLTQAVLNRELLPVRQPSRRRLRQLDRISTRERPGSPEAREIRNPRELRKPRKLRKPRELLIPRKH